MPSLTEFRENFYEDSAKASDLIRKGAISAIAGIWVISNTPKSPSSLFGNHTKAFVISALFFLLAIACDVLQNIGSTFAGWSTIKAIEREIRENPKILDEFPVPSRQRNTSWFFFRMKIVLAGVGIASIIVGLIQILWIIISPHQSQKVQWGGLDLNLLKWFYCFVQTITQLSVTNCSLRRNPWGAVCFRFRISWRTWNKRRDRPKLRQHSLATAPPYDAWRMPNPTPLLWQRAALQKEHLE